MDLVRGYYIGPETFLRGRSALIRGTGGGSEVIAQFEDLRLGKLYSHNWTYYPREYFDIDPKDEETLGFEYQSERPLRFE